jgi:hypothetical protein
LLSRSPICAKVEAESSEIIGKSNHYRYILKEALAAGGEMSGKISTIILIFSYNDPTYSTHNDLGEDGLATLFSWAAGFLVLGIIALVVNLGPAAKIFSKWGKRPVNQPISYAKMS